MVEAEKSENWGGAAPGNPMLPPLNIEAISVGGEHIYLPIIVDAENYENGGESAPGNPMLTPHTPPPMQSGDEALQVVDEDMPSQGDGGGGTHEMVSQDPEEQGEDSEAGHQMEISQEESQEDMEISENVRNSKYEKR